MTNENILKDRTSELTQAEKVELLSEDVQEIMGQVPHWIVRCGITVILSVVILLVIGSFIFKYPDVITSTIVINSENPSAEVIARSNGKIDFLLVKNGDNVKTGEVLAILENPANYQNIADLNKILSEFNVFFDSPFSHQIIDLSKVYSLGQIQPAFSGFKRQYEDYLNFLSIDIIRKKIIAVKNQNNDYLTYNDRLKNQADNQKKYLELTRKQFLRDSTLFQNTVIAAADYEKSEQIFLQVKNTYQNLMASVANTQMQMNQLNYQIIDLESQQLEQTQSKINLLRESYDNLRATVAEWEKSYLLVSPVEGKITFNQFWSKNQFVTSGETVFTVVPTLPQRIIGRAKIPIAGSGKAAIGQRVLVYLDNFPYMEFGMLEGKLESLSQVPEYTKDGAFYTAEISFPDVLSTNYGKILPFQQELQGSAEIITKNLCLFDRLINPFKSALKKSI